MFRRRSGLGKREVTCKAQCACCTTKLPFSFDGYATKTVPSTLEPLAVQAALFTLYSCLSAEKWKRSDENPELSELSGLNCDKCGSFSEHYYMLPLSEQDGFFSPPLCPGCVMRTRANPANPFVLLRLSANDADLRLMLRRYRKAYLAKAADTEAPEPAPSAELTF